MIPEEDTVNNLIKGIRKGAIESLKDVALNDFIPRKKKGKNSPGEQVNINESLGLDREASDADRSFPGDYYGSRASNNQNSANDSNVNISDLIRFG